MWLQEILSDERQVEVAGNPSCDAHIAGRVGRDILVWNSADVPVSEVKVESPRQGKEHLNDDFVAWGVSFQLLDRRGVVAAWRSVGVEVEVGIRRFQAPPIPEIP